MRVGDEASAPQEPATAKPYPAGRLLIILMALNVVAYLDRSILSLAAPAIETDLGLSHTQMSTLLGLAFALSFALLGLPCGWLVDRFSRRWVVSIGVLVWSLCASTTGLANSYWTLLLARFGIGTGEAALGPAAYSMMNDSMPPRHRALAATIYGGSSGVGAAASAAVGGLMLAYMQARGDIVLPLFGTLRPWQFVLLLSGLPGLLLAAAIFLVAEPPRNEALLASARQREAPDATSAPGFVRFMKSQWRIFAPVILGYSMLQITAYSTASWLPTYMVQHFGWDIGDVGLAMSLAAVASFVCAFPAGWAVDRLVESGVVDGALRWIVWAGLVCAVFLGVAFAVSNPFWCIGFMIAGQAPIALIGTVSLALQQVTPAAYRGRVVATVIVVSNGIGLSLGPLIPAWLTDHVFRRSDALGGSIAITAFISGVLAVVTISLARPAVRALLTDRSRGSNG